MGTVFFYLALGFPIVWGSGAANLSTIRYAVGFWGSVVVILLGFITFGLGGGILYGLGLVAVGGLSWAVNLGLKLNRVTTGLNSAMSEISRKAYVEAELTRLGELDPDSDEQVRVEMDEPTADDRRAGKSDRVINKRSKKTYTVSTVIRNGQIEYHDHVYDMAVETAIFEGVDAISQPVSQIDWVGADHRKVAVLHSYAKAAAVKELGSCINNPQWWAEHLEEKGFAAELETEWVAYYDAEHTIVLIAKHGAA